ncbi:MAG: putative peptide transporter, permease protein, partial [Ramlibacter sp.]|nr:putative peptide transporter, permease protein [Ramlibacter sp.]
MLAFLLRRIAATLPVLVIVALIVFLMLRLAPGDPAAAILGDNASSSAIKGVRTELGLEQTIPV